LGGVGEWWISGQQKKQKEKGKVREWRRVRWTERWGRLS
jgi:hypothetical protein